MSVLLLNYSPPEEDDSPDRLYHGPREMCVSLALFYTAGEGLFFWPVSSLSPCRRARYGRWHWPMSPRWWVFCIAPGTIRIWSEAMKVFGCNLPCNFNEMLLWLKSNQTTSLIGFISYRASMHSLTKKENNSLYLQLLSYNSLRSAIRKRLFTCPSEYIFSSSISPSRSKRPSKHGAHFIHSS